MSVLNLSPASSSDRANWSNTSPTAGYWYPSDNAYIGSLGAPEAMSISVRVAGAGDVAGNTVDSAYFVPYASANSSNTTNHKVYLEDADSPSVPTSFATANALVLTTAAIDWDVTSTTVNTQFSSPDIASAVQEVVDRGGFGGSLQVVVKDDGTANTKFRRCYIYNATYNPSLDITYSAGGGGGSTSNMLLLGC